MSSLANVPSDFVYLVRVFSLIAGVAFTVSRPTPKTRVAAAVVSVCVLVWCWHVVAPMR